MFGVCRYIHTLRKAIENGEKEIKWSGHSGKANNDNSMMMAQSMLADNGYKLKQGNLSLIRASRVLVYVKE